MSVHASSLHGAAKRVVPISLHIRFLHPFRSFFLAGHIGERRMYDSIKKELYWPYIADDTLGSARDCRSRTQNRIHSKQPLPLRPSFLKAI